ncbi:MAG: hypothetical protein LHV68_00645 [Elusimicrobia bacterium]|nr:hypothetical protein [Candidatus Liberimonas magnetica]
MEETKSRMLKIVLSGVIIIALVAGLGPIFVSYLAKKTFKPRKLLIQEAPLKIKAHGTISILADKLVLTTPNGINNYIIYTKDKDMDRLKKYANKKTEVYLFGKLVKAETNMLNKVKIRADIEVESFDTKDFNAGEIMTAQVAQAIKEKLREKAEIKAKVFAKLGLPKDSILEVISGKLKVVNCIVFQGGSKQIRGLNLLIQDKYGDLYALRADDPKYSAEKFKKLASADLDVVVTGHLTVPNPNLLIPGLNNYMMFVAKDIYNNDDKLSELNLQ